MNKLKMLVKSAVILIGSVVMCGFAVSANPTIVDRGNGLLYDTDLDITWLQDANYALTSNYDSDGLMTWQEAVVFIDYLNSIKHLGYEDWRLPTTMQPDPSCQSQGDYLGDDGIIDTSWGYNCIGSEMGHLYYMELGNPAGGPFTNTGPFSNVLAYNGYWSGTASILEANYYWHFVFGFGGSHMISNYAQLNVIPVRDGDVVVIIPDNDGDGYNTEIDCDDQDSSVYPGAPELCDGKDNDCDGSPMDTEIDTDEDGYLACDDCDDEDYAVNKDAIEIPNNYVDENCDGDFGDCYPCDSWRNHGAYVRCVAHAVDEWCGLGVFTEEECDNIVNSAAKSDIGKKGYTSPECE